jgi:hypothetical protein
MKKSGKLKVMAALCLGIGYPSFGACQAIYANFTMPSNKSTCYEIYGSNVTFNGNGYKLTGTTAQASSVLIAVKGYNVTVKNVEIDCNTKATGIEYTNAGTSKAEAIRISNCTYGVRKINTGLNISGKLDGGSNMMNNFFDVINTDVGSTNMYTADLDGFQYGSGYGVFTNYAPFYDYRSLFYQKRIAIIAASNSYFWLNKTSFFLNKVNDLYVNSVPTVYLSGVSWGFGYQTILNINSKIVTF